MELILLFYGQKVDCWVPTTGDIAGIKRAEFTGTMVPCLVSRADRDGKGDKSRRTAYTVEAISLCSGDEEPVWIGINQINANRSAKSDFHGTVLLRCICARKYAVDATQVTH